MYPLLGCRVDPILVKYSNDSVRSMRFSRGQQPLGRPDGFILNIAPALEPSYLDHHQGHNGFTSSVLGTVICRAQAGLTAGFGMRLHPKGPSTQ